MKRIITALTHDGKGAAEAMCQEETGGITSSFVPTAALIDFPQWKNSEANGHIGWFFLRIKEGCT